MKFDKLMTIFYRNTCVITGVVFIFCFCVSCFRTPLKASAFSPADPTLWASIVDEWRDEYENNLASTLHEINQGLANGDINYSTNAGKRYLEVMALQALALNNNTMSIILHAVDLASQTVPDFSGIESLPDTASVSGSGASGVYRSALDNNLHGVSVFQPLSAGTYTGTVTATFALSDEFTYRIQFVTDPNSSLIINRLISSGYIPDIPLKQYGYYYRGNIHYIGDNYLYDADVYSSTQYTDKEFGCSLNIDNSIPTVSRYYSYNTSTNFPGERTIGACGTSVTLPVETIDTSSPWEYYNDTILPYIQQNYPEITNNYLVFPNGWVPAPTPDPTEPPTFPNGGISIENQYNIGINIIYPTDASGQPLTDASGETVTETQYITDTSPLDGEYSFKMPTLPHLTIYDATLPNPDASTYSDGIGFIWDVCYNILTSTGLMPVVMICFALALFGYILWKLGG